MIALEKTDLTIKILEKVIKTICPIYDETEYVFDKSQSFIATLKLAYEEIQKLDIEEVGTELWNNFSNINKTNTLNREIYIRYEKLLNWKKAQVSMTDLNGTLSRDVVSFCDKELSIFQGYTDQEKTELLHFYARISQRLFKAKLDLNKLIKEFEKKEAEKGNDIKPELYKSNVTTPIRILENKKAEFASILANMHDSQFFVSTDSSVSLSKDDLLIEFGKLLNTKFTYIQTNEPNESAAEAEIIKLSDLKPFQDFLLHERRKKLAEELRKEFSTEKAKAIRILLGAMELYNPPLITVGNRQGKEIHKSLAIFFDRDIGTYQGVFGHIIDHKIDKPDLDSITVRLNHVLKIVENG